jgi:hypothetical protein
MIEDLRRMVRKVEREGMRRISGGVRSTQKTLSAATGINSADEVEYQKMSYSCELTESRTCNTSRGPNDVVLGVHEADHSLIKH